MSECTNGELRDLLPELVNGRLDTESRERVEAHVASCMECADELALLRSLRPALTREPVIDTQRIANAVLARTANGASRAAPRAGIAPRGGVGVGAAARRGGGGGGVGGAAQVACGDRRRRAARGRGAWIRREDPWCDWNAARRGRAQAGNRHERYGQPAASSSGVGARTHCRTAVLRACRCPPTSGCRRAAARRRSCSNHGRKHWRARERVRSLR